MNVDEYGHQFGYLYDMKQDFTKSVTLTPDRVAADVCEIEEETGKLYDIRRELEAATFGVVGI